MMDDAEALYGTRPFTGASLPEAVAQMRAGRIAAVANSKKVPPKLHRAILQGLPAAPAQRFVGLAPLLGVLAGANQTSAITELSQPPRPRWSRVPWPHLVATALATLLPQALAKAADDPAVTIIDAGGLDGNRLDVSGEAFE